MTPATTTTRTMTALPLDPMAATIHLRIEELRADTTRHRLRREAREARGNGRDRVTWPGAVVVALRESLARATAGRPGPVCTTC